MTSALIYALILVIVAAVLIFGGIVSGNIWYLVGAAIVIVSLVCGFLFFK
jgi:hypothetical protein